METTNQAGNAANGTLGVAAAKVVRSLGADICEAQREPKFDELKESQQIQVLRRELRITRELLNSQQGIIDRLIRHQHGPAGAVVVEAFGMSGGAAGSRRDPLA